MITVSMIENGREGNKSRTCEGLRISKLGKGLGGRWSWGGECGWNLMVARTSPPAPPRAARGGLSGQRRVTVGRR